jgi:hypothetical protein
LQAKELKELLAINRQAEFNPGAMLFYMEEREKCARKIWDSDFLDDSSAGYELGNC